MNTGEIILFSGLLLMVGIVLAPELYRWWASRRR